MNFALLHARKGKKLVPGCPAKSANPSIGKYLGGWTDAPYEYHIYGVWWKDANNVWMYHNGQRVATITTGGPLTVPQYMFFDQEAFTWAGLPTVESLQDNTRNAMYVDWVHAWRLVPQ
jgi:beta-glucanase (GH16 family)